MDTSEASTIAGDICAHRGLTLIRHVGAGAFKHSFEVVTAAGERRALKVYKAAGSINARQQREVEAMRRCDHPSIARLDAVSVHAAHLFSLEEFLSGGTLAERLKNGPLTRESTLSLGSALLDAIAHMDARKLVHRDLKPENIMFRLDGTPVVVDFGLVRDLSQDSVTVTWAPQGPGTPFYAAPEQLNNNKALIDWRTDQFALGVVLAIGRFEQHPYDTGSHDGGEIVARVAGHGRPSGEFAAAARKDALACLPKMVSAWPVHRYRTCGELVAAWRGQA